MKGNIVVWESDGDIYGAEIPEPATLSLLALGAISLLKRRRGLSTSHAVED